MTSYIFQQLANKGKAEGIDDSIRQRDARTWYRQAAQQAKSVNTSRMMGPKADLKAKIQTADIGSMVMFFYDPKHKETLPYYDTFPLIFIVDMTSDGFVGINLHYLPPLLRAKLMDALYSTTSDKKYNESTKLGISYRLLSSASRYKYFKPCYKRYLWSHVRSSFLFVYPRMWDAALMLPTARFQKATTATVWKESKEIANA